MNASSVLGRRALRCAATALAVLFGGLLAGACNDLIAGDRASVTEQLCQQLGDCYGRDAYPCQILDAQLRGVGETARQAFLDAYSEEACLETCPGSLACLDHEPFCETGEGDCEVEQGCCGWSSGLAACQEGKCCAPRGVFCGDHGDRACCDSACINGYCGGQACVLVGETCRRGDECCSRRCEDGECAAKTCADLGDPCLADADCCNPPSGVVTSSPIEVVCDPGARVCVLSSVETCVGLGSPCDPNGSGVPCCGGPELACIPGLDGGICGVPGCLGPGVDCAFDEQCCGDLLCDYSLGEPRCANKPLSCGKAGEPCGECCPGRDCLETGFCSEVNETGCAERVCHDPELVGAPMGADDCLNEVYGCCVQAVATNDPYCTCFAWDLVCAEAANTVCPVPCN